MRWYSHKRRIHDLIDDQESGLCFGGHDFYWNRFILLRQRTVPECLFSLHHRSWYGNLFVPYSHHLLHPKKGKYLIKNLAKIVKILISKIMF